MQNVWVEDINKGLKNYSRLQHEIHLQQRQVQAIFLRNLSFMYNYDSISKFFCTFFKDIITCFHTILLQMFYFEPNILLLTETPSVLNNLKFGYNLNQNPKKWIRCLNWLHLSWCIYIWKNQYIASTDKLLEPLKVQHKIWYTTIVLALLQLLMDFSDTCRYTLVRLLRCLRDSISGLWYSWLSHHVVM